MTFRQIRSPSSATDSTERLLRDRRRRIRFCSSWEQTREQEEQKMAKEAWEKRSGKRLCISAVCRIDYRRWDRALEASLHLPLSRPGVHREIEELVDITRHRTIIRSFQARFGASILLSVALASARATSKEKKRNDALFMESTTKEWRRVATATIYGRIIFRIAAWSPLATDYKCHLTSACLLQRVSKYTKRRIYYI